MKITAVETIRFGEFPNVVYVRLQTDEGLTGLGETFFGAAAVSAWIHETASPYLLGKDPLQIDRHWMALNPFLGFNSSGVENRGRSAVDGALWDIMGKAAGMPVYQLLGGATRESIPIYNTCAGYSYVRRRSTVAGLSMDNWGRGDSSGPYEDLQAFLTDAGALAESLLSEGITGMKIWPFDTYADETGGHYISNADLKRATEPFKKIRDAVGDRMDIMVELHSLWDLPSAIRIAQAVEEFRPAWIEDPIKMDNLRALGRFSESTRVPTAASETLGTRWAFRDLAEHGGVGVVILDPNWAGGVSEAKRIATMMEAYQLPITIHDCSGPVEFALAVHLSINAPNAFVQESVRAFLTGWYRELVTVLPKVEHGRVWPLTGPGIGTELLPGVTEREDAVVRIDRLSDQ